MDLLRGFGIEEGFDGAPQHPESGTRVDDEHAVKCLPRK